MRKYFQNERFHKDIVEKGLVAIASRISGKISLKSAALVTYGTMVAQKTISTLVGELAKNGNQTTSTSLSNAVGLVGAATAIIATQGLALIPMAIDGAVQAFNMSRTISRVS